MADGVNPKDLIGVKKAPLRYVPAALAIEASGPMADGAKKYDPYNWREKPILMSGYIEATERHLAALKDGQDFAEDSGHSHVGHIAANMGILADAKAHGTLIDDRFKGPAADMLRARDKSQPAVQVVSDDVLSPNDVQRIMLMYQLDATFSTLGIQCWQGFTARGGTHLIHCPRYK